MEFNAILPVISWVLTRLYALIIIDKLTEIKIGKISTRISPFSFQFCLPGYHTVKKRYYTEPIKKVLYISNSIQRRSGSQKMDKKMYETFKGFSRVHRDRTFQGFLGKSETFFCSTELKKVSNLKGSVPVHTCRTFKGFVNLFIRFSRPWTSLDASRNLRNLF